MVSESANLSSVDLITIVDSKIDLVRTRSLDISFNELLDMYENEELEISPEYQRLFRWHEENQSRFIESLILEMPIPPIYVIETEEGIYELIDGLQRLSSYFHFRGALKDKPGEFLCLTGCDIVDELNGYTYEDLPKSLQIKLKRNFIRVEIIRRGSDERLRYHLFKRLNTGGEILSEQEIRNSVIRLLDNTFNEFIIDLSEHSDFKACIMNISDGDRDRKGDQEYVLKFFAYKNDRESYRKDIAPFLSKYMEKVSFGQIGDEEKGIDFSFEEEREIFEKTFSVLSKVGGEYVFSRLRDGNYTKTLVPNFYDAITIGIQKYLNELYELNEEQYKELEQLFKNIKQNKDFLKHASGGGKNTKRHLEQRISYVEQKVGEWLDGFR